MSDLISRQNAIDVLEILADKMSDEGQTVMAQAIAVLKYLHSAEPERNIIRCADCKWWDRLEEGHPYGYCRACRSGTHTDRWEISIYRQNRFDFFCADAEPKENEDDDE